MIKIVIDVAIPALTFFMMCLVGIDLERGRLKDAVRVQRLIAGAVGGQIVLIPAIGLAMAALMALPEPVAFGILLIAACPAGTISNFYVMLAGANVALSVILTILGCLAAAITIPACFAVYDWWLGQTNAIAVPARMLFGQLALLVALPIALGAWLRHVRPALATDHARLLRVLGLIALAGLVGFIIAQKPGAVAVMITGQALTILIFSLATFVAGWGLGKAFGADAENAFTVAVEFMARNLAIAAVIAVSILHRVDFAAFAVAVFVYQVPLFLIAAWWHRRRAA